MPDRPFVALTVVALLEGAALLAYAAFDVVEAVRVGITGPEEVSNPAALTLLIVLTAGFGAGLVWVGIGWWRGRRWARAPFVFAQVLVVLIGYELSQSEGSAERYIGIGAALVGVVGLVLAFAPGVSRRLGEDDTLQSA